MDTTYRKNLKAVLTASKNYTDNSIEKLKWELGTYDLSVTTDSTTAYTKTIPTNAIKGRLNYIGGASKVSENLIDFPNLENVGSNAGNTYNISFNGMTTLTLNVKCTSLNTLSTDTKWQGHYIYYENDTIISQGAIQQLSFTQVNQQLTVSLNLNIPSNCNKLRLDLGAYYSTDAKFTISNIMLNKGSTALPYSPYFENIRSAKTTSVKFEGANKWDEYFEIGSIDISNGQNITASATCRCKNYQSVMPNTTYTLNYVYRVFYYDSSNNYLGYSGLADTTGVGKQFTTPYNCAYVRFNFVSEYGTTYLNNIRLNLGTTLLPYTPYIVPITKAIPSEIQALEGYGQSNPEDSTKFNYIDFDKKIYVELGHIDENDEWQELATPVETDISQYIDDDFKNIDTTNMTTITFENEFEYDVPSEIDYLIEEVKA